MTRLASLLLLALALVVTPANAGTVETADPVAYIQELKKVGDDTGKRVEIHCAYVRAMAAKSKAELSDALFPGIKEKLGTAAAEVVKLREAKGDKDPEFLRLKQLVGDTLTAVQADIDYVKAHILDAVAMPKDAYGGADKEKLRSAVAAAWKERYPQDQVLAIRLPEANWNRKVTEEWVGDTKKRYDISSMVVQVVVKKSDEVATIHGAYLQIDHHESEALKIGQKDAGFAARDMWAKNVK